MAHIILLIEQDSDRVSALRSEVSSLGYETFHATDRLEALNLHRAHRFDAVLADLDVWRAGADEPSNILGDFADASPVIILTELAGIARAAQALKAGAFLYLVRPLSRDQLQMALERAFASRALRTGNAASDQHPRPSAISPSFIGSSRKMRVTLDQALTAARSEASVFLFGESGTGKELVAHAIHAQSARAKHPFVPVDCASLPDNLLEAELFGYEKGAFTGAASAKPGLMETANHGTLFLDEIGELPLALQPKLLRALQERQHRRVGGLRFINFDVRVISATNRDLRGAISEGRFRADLFYPFHVLPIHLPSLRESPDGVAALAQHFLGQYGGTRHPPIRSLEPAALRMLQEYSWPGNVRELQNVIEYACAVAEDDTIQPADLPLDLRSQPTARAEPSPSGRLSAKFKAAKASFEVEYVSELLKRHNGNVSAAAKAAGVDRKTLYYLLNKHHINSVRDIPARRPRLRVVKP
jgi:DNA-binding NtrC family response regulator